MVFLEQRAESFEVWQDPIVTLRMPKLFNLRADPFERGDTDGIGYKTWRFERTFLMAPAQVYVAKWMQSFKDFPPRQKPGLQPQPRHGEADASQRSRPSRRYDTAVKAAGELPRRLSRLPPARRARPAAHVALSIRC